MEVSVVGGFHLTFKYRVYLSVPRVIKYRALSSRVVIKYGVDLSGVCVIKYLRYFGRGIELPLHPYNLN